MKIKKKKGPGGSGPRESTPAAAPTGKGGAAVHLRDIREVIQADTIPYLVWREWLKARNRNDYPLLHAMSEEASTLREVFGPLETFVEKVRRNRSSVPGMRVSDLWRITVNDRDEAMIIASDGHRDRTQSSYLAERWSLKRVGEEGWRIVGIAQKTVPRDQDPRQLRNSEFED